MPVKNNSRFNPYKGCENLKPKLLKNIMIGLGTGFLNGLFGSGGGMIAAPLFRKNGLQQNKAQATAAAVILPLCIITACFYLFTKSIGLVNALPYIPGGIIGSVLGAKLLAKVPQILLRQIFALVIIYCALRMLWV